VSSRKLIGVVTRPECPSGFRPLPSLLLSSTSAIKATKCAKIASQPSGRLERSCSRDQSKIGGISTFIYNTLDADEVSRDPIGESVGTNLYSYVANDPIYWLDPFGLAPFQSSGKVNVDGDYNYGPPSDHGDTTTQSQLPGGAHANSDLDDYVASTPAARAAGVKIGDPADFTANGKTVHCTVQDARGGSGVEVSRKAASDAGLTPTDGNGVKLNGSDADIPGTVTYPNTLAPAPPTPAPPRPGGGAYNPKRA
jgi:RHS repeat-associated protein